VVDKSLLFKDIPPEKIGDYDYMMTLLDWDANVDPYFKQNHYLEPTPAHNVDAMRAEGYHENWIVYGSPYYSAKELTVYPQRRVTIKDAGAYGLICVQGYGRFGEFQISAPSMIRFGEMTEDEFFVSHDAAAAGIQITNLSTTEPLVILKHFNPGNPEMPEH
jgi:hypothetical protein